IILILSFCLSIVFALVILILFKSLFPIENRLLGSEPKKLVQDDFIKGDNYDELRIIGNRIFLTQDAIDKSLLSYSKRLNSYKKTYKVLFIGILMSIILITIIFLLCQF